MEKLDQRHTQVEQEGVRASDTFLPWSQNAQYGFVEQNPSRQEHKEANSTGRAGYLAAHFRNLKNERRQCKRCRTGRRRSVCRTCWAYGSRNYLYQNPRRFFEAMFCFLREKWKRRQM